MHRFIFVQYKQQDTTFHNLFIYFCKTLYVFHTVFPSIFRSSKVHIQRQVFVRPLLLSAANVARIATGIARSKRDGTCAETRFGLSAKRTSPFKSAGVSVQSTAGSRGVRISGQQLYRPCSDVQFKDYWLPTPFASFPFTSPPVRRVVPSDSESAIPALVWQIHDTICTVLSSWWWTENPLKHVERLTGINKLWNVVSCCLYFTNIKRCTDLWMSKFNLDYNYVETD